MNGNPFYVPPVIPDMSDQIMEFGKMAMQKDNLAAQRAIEDKKFASDEKYRTGMMENANQDLNLKREEAYSKNPNIRPYSEGEYTKLLMQIQPVLGDTVNKISFINGPLKEMAKNPNFRRGDIANMMEQKWPEIYSQTSDEVRNEILSLSKKTAGMSPMDPKYKEVTGQIEKLGQFQTALDNIKNPKEVFFKDIYDYDQNTKAALLSQGDATRAANLQPDTQFMKNKTIEYMNGGMTQDKATVKAYQDLSDIKAAQARAGRAVTTIGGVPQMAGGKNISTGEAGTYNDSALSGLSKSDAETVKAIAEYRFPVSNLRNKHMMALVQRAYAYDPTFDAKEYGVRSGVRKDFSSGKASQTVLSLNTAVGHLNSLSKSATDLDNGSVQVWNKFRNALTTGLSDDSRVTKFNTTANAVAGELATVFKNTSGTDQEIKSWHDKISSSQTPKQLKDNIQEAIQLIGSRLDALHNKYEQGMGKKADFQLLSPKSREILKGLGVDVDKFDPASQKSSQPVATNDFRNKYNY